MAGGRMDHALERLVFFSDAVFAIAITLLVIELKVPHPPRGSPDSAYWQALARQGPAFAGYFFSFFVIGAFWAGHHRAFSLAGRYDPKVLGWNLMMLLAMAFMPFVTAFLSQNVGARVPTFVYCLVLLAAALLNIKVGRMATGPTMVARDVPPEAIDYVRRRGLSVALGAATAIAVSLIYPILGQASLISIPLWRRAIAKRPPKHKGAGVV
jgi:TMEM175 potassium channel family protein